MDWLMGIRLVLPVVTTAFILESCNCKEDKYGEILELLVPITTYPAKDTFLIGDTLWIEANFNKDVEVFNTSNTIRLDSFNFFTELSISEISDTAENWSVDIDTIVEIGRLEYLPLITASVYPLVFIEDNETYKFKAGLILNSPGLLFIGFLTPSFLYEEPSYNHPALYTCNKNKRDHIEIIYFNPSTTEEAYNALFLNTKVEYLKDLVDFERYSNGGAITIVVQ